MSINSQGGVVMFGPQAGKGIVVATPNWHPHRAVEIDMGIGDDQRVFPAEVGGRPMPGGAFKGGVAVGGSIGMYPRLSGSIGWILLAQMGKKISSTKALVHAGIIAATKTTTGSQVITTNLGTIPSPGAKLCVRIHKADSIAYTASIIVTGPTDLTETLNFSTGPGAGQRAEGLDTNPATAIGYETLVGAIVFTSVTNITIPAHPNAATEPVYVSVGYEDKVGLTHLFGIDDSSPNMVPWVGVRKYIPKGEASEGLGETYLDCKVLSHALSLPNDGLVASRVDLLGRDFIFESEPSWAVAPDYEAFDSAAISSSVGGYVSVPFFDSNPLPVVNAAFNWVNSPSDQKTERVFGSPFLEDIPISGRQLSVALTLKWNNPDLYRQIIGGSKTATKWSPKPFTCRVDAITVSPSLMPGSMVPYSLRVQAQQVMFGLRGSIKLGGVDTILIPLIGTAIDVGGTYASYALTNLQAESHYTWPTV